MKKETIKNIVSAIKMDTPNANAFLVVTDDNTGAHTLVDGDMSDVALAILCTIFDDKSPAHANKVYSIIKNVVCNMLNVPSPMSNDLAAALKEKLEDYGKEK